MCVYVCAYVFVCVRVLVWVIPRLLSAIATPHAQI